MAWTFKDINYFCVVMFRNFPIYKSDVKITI